MPIGYFADTADFSWQALPLASGWEQYDNTGVYTPSFRRTSGIIFISGLARSNVANSTSGYVTIANLPVGCRPYGLHSVGLWGSGGYSTIIFNTSGAIQIGGPVAVNFAQWVGYSFST